MSKNTNTDVVATVEAEDLEQVVAVPETENHSAETDVQNTDEGAEATLDLAEHFDFQDGGSPYKLIKSANRLFKAIGWAKELPTQMGYAYTKSGAIDGTKREGPNPTKGVTFSRETGLKWVAEYIKNNLK